MAALYEAEVAAQRVVVLDDGRRLSGYMVAWPENDAYFIENIGVEPEEQGQGLGRQLIDYAIIEAHHFGLPALRLYTNAAMIENLAMYAHLGFVELNRGTENGFHRVYMRLALSGKRP